MTTSANHQTSPTSDAQVYNIADETYLKLLKEIDEIGYIEGNSRTGVGTKAIFAREIRFDLSKGYMPLLTTKKMFTKGAIYELLWFFGNHMFIDKYKDFSSTNAKYLIDNNVNIWVGDLYKKYLQAVKDTKKYINDNEYGYYEIPRLHWITKENEEPFTKEEFIDKIKKDDDFADEFAECGPIYGFQWRGWVGVEGITDQLQNAIDKLKKNPTDRRIMVSAWNVDAIEHGDMVLPPCHYGYTFFTRLLSLDERIDLASQDKHFDVCDFGIGPQVTDEHCHEVCDRYEVPRRALSLKWNQRSVDTPLGLPFNIISYALLLRMVAKEVGMLAEELIGSLENTHYYLNQLEGVKEHISRKVLHSSPKLWLNPEKSIFEYQYEDIKIVDYVSQSEIKFPLSN